MSLFHFELSQIRLHYISVQNKMCLLCPWLSLVLDMGLSLRSSMTMPGLFLCCVRFFTELSLREMIVSEVFRAQRLIVPSRVGNTCTVSKKPTHKALKLSRRLEKKFRPPSRGASSLPSHLYYQQCDPPSRREASSSWNGSSCW